MNLPFSVTPDEITDQRRRGWPDWHPEMFCHRCGARNIASWFVDSNLWDAAKLARPDDWPGSDIVCPQCFADAFEAATGLEVTWELRMHHDTVTAAIRRLAQGKASRG